MAQDSTPQALIFSATAEFRHDSIPTAIQALTSHGQSAGIQFDATEDKSRFTDDGLSAYTGLVFLMNTGEVLDDNGKAALQRFFDRGGNFVGIHSASDCLRNTTFYGQEVGAYFDYHPALQNATVDVVDASHPSTSMLPTQWHVQDEMYNFKSDPRAVGAVVLLSANESSYTDPGPRKFNQGTPHPTAWYQEHGAGVSSNGTAGRSFYTSLGHLNETWEDDTFMAHVMGGIQWALASNASASNPTSSGSTASASGSPTGTSTSSTAASPSSATEFARLPRVDVAILCALLGAFLLLRRPTHQAHYLNDVDQTSSGQRRTAGPSGQRCLLLSLTTSPDLVLLRGAFVAKIGRVDEAYPHLYDSRHSLRWLKKLILDPRVLTILANYNHDVFATYEPRSLAWS